MGMPSPASKASTSCNRKEVIMTTNLDTGSTHLRGLTTNELDQVSGGNPMAIAAFILGTIAGEAIGQIGTFKPVLEFKGGKMHVAGQPIK